MSQKLQLLAEMFKDLAVSLDSAFRRLQRRKVVIAVVVAIAAVPMVIAAVWMLRYRHTIQQLTRGVGDTTFYTADGRPWFRMDEQRQDVPLAAISPYLRNAVLATEDHRFYHHPGIDPIALVRALVHNLRRGGVVEGGSTLTQQLARTLFLSNRRTFGRKLREAALAVMLELYLPKDRILELYLNRVYLSAGVYGVEPMARNLFGKPAKDVTLPEAALIAGLIEMPSRLSPWSNPEGAVRHSHVVLARMREAKFISPEEERVARETLLHARPYPDATEVHSGYAKQLLRQEFRAQFGVDHPADWQVHTTFVAAVQEAAERAIADGLERLHQPGLQAALVAMNPQTGDIVALVGGSDFRRYPFDRATQSRRQPGSAFKPIVYAAALDHGFSPVSVLSGLNGIVAPGADEWSPQNAHGEVFEELTLRAALVRSDNRAAVALQQQVGTPTVVRFASSAGLHDLPEVPSLALGTGDVSLLELTTAYAMFPNGGIALLPRSLVQVLDAQGGVQLERAPQGTRVLSPESAFQMVSILEDVLDRGTGAPARAMGVRFPSGGKTGTTDEYKDAWFVGFSSSVVAGVWVGFDQPAPIGREAYGARIALPIWSDFMRRTAPLLPPNSFAAPDSLIKQSLCSVSYLNPVEACPVYTEYFKSSDQIPSGLCLIHQGPVKESLPRAVGGVFGSFGRKLKKLFKW